MKNKGKTKRLMWMTTAACAMMFLGMGVCLICGLRAARESIEESSKRDMEVVMEQLEKPYAMRLNTSDELTETMERYLFSQGRREIDLAADGRFLSALNGKSVRDVLFVTTDGHYVSVRGRTGWQKMDRENSGRLTAGKTVSGYRSWNGEEAFFVVKPIEPFFVQGEPYDAIALAYTPAQSRHMARPARKTARSASRQKKPPRRSSFDSRRPSFPPSACRCFPCPSSAIRFARAR